MTSDRDQGSRTAFGQAATPGVESATDDAWLTPSESRTPSSATLSATRLEAGKPSAEVPQEGSAGREDEKREKHDSLVSFDNYNDIEGAARFGDPNQFPSHKKWTLLLVTATSSLCVTCTSSIVASAYDGIERDFGIGQITAILGLSLFVIGLGTGPLLLAPFSEFYGRRPIYLASFTAFWLIGFPVAFANNAAVFFIFRFFSGFTGSAFLSVAGGTVSDMWVGADSFMPMATYTVSPFLGPVLGPVFSGFIVQFAGYNAWRWNFRTMIIWSFVQLLLIVFLLPESFAPKILMSKARHLRKVTGDDTYESQHERVLKGKSLVRTVLSSSTRVFQLLAMEPMLSLLCLWCAILLGILYLFFELFPIVFAKHNFNEYQNGLAFLGIGFGMLFALATTPYYARRYRRACEDSGGKAEPEARLEMAKVGAFATPIGLFIFAFTSYEHVHWIAPILAGIPFGFGTQYIYTAVFNYTTDNWRPVAASAMGANSVSRSTFAAAFPLFANQMAASMGTVGAAAFLAGLNVLIIPLPFVFSYYGQRLRAKCKFALG